MKFAQEDYSLELVAEILPLLALHHKEISDKFYGPLDPVFEIYAHMQRTNALRIYTVRDFRNSEMKLMGYQIFFVTLHHHSKESIHATQDVLFLHREARRGMAGMQFIQWCGEKLRMEGVHTLHQRISARHNFGRLLERIGYELEDLTYSKNLQEGI